MGERGQICDVDADEVEDEQEHVTVFLLLGSEVVERHESSQIIDRERALACLFSWYLELPERVVLCELFIQRVVAYGPDVAQVDGAAIDRAAQEHRELPQPVRGDALHGDLRVEGRHLLHGGLINLSCALAGLQPEELLTHFEKGPLRARRAFCGQCLAQLGCGELVEHAALSQIQDGGLGTGEQRGQQTGRSSVHGVAG